MRHSDGPKRSINKELLRKHISIQGRRGKELTAVAVDCSVSLLEKMMSSKGRPAPEKNFRVRMCNHFQVSEDDLFPKTEEFTSEASTEKVSIPVTTNTNAPGNSHPTQEAVV